MTENIVAKPEIEGDSGDEAVIVQRIEANWFSFTLLLPIFMSIYTVGLTNESIDQSLPILDTSNLQVLKDVIITKYQYKSIVIPNLKNIVSENKEELLSCLSHADYKVITQSINEMKEMTQLYFHQDLLQVMNKSFLFSTDESNKIRIKNLKVDLKMFFNELFKSLNFFKINFNLILSLNNKVIDEVEKDSSHNLHSTNIIRDMKNSVQLFSNSIIRLKSLSGLWEENTSNKAD